MSKRSTQKESTRRKILGAAYHVYAEQGFSAPTAVIASEAGVAHGTVFVHFPALDDLVMSLIRDFSETLIADLHRLAQARSDLRALLETHIDVLAIHEEFYIRLVSDRSLLLEEARMTFANIQSLVAFHFSGAIERGVDEGVIKNIPVHMIFNTWMGLVHYYLLNKDLFSPEGPVVVRYRKELVETFLELVQA